LIKELTAGDSNFAEGKPQPLGNPPPEIPLEQRCNYCGQIIDPQTTTTCASCGTARIPPIIEAPSTSVIAAPVLNARKATLILLAFLIAQFCFAVFCGMVFAVAGGISQPSGNLEHHSRLPAGFLAVSVLIGYVGAGLTMIGISFNLIRESLHDGSEVGAAWVLGRWDAIAKGLAMGASLAMGFFIIAIIVRPEANEDSVGPLTRLSMTPGMPQILWLMMALFLAPPLEEMLFRGVLYGGYRQSLGPSRSAWLTTTIFALLHVTEVIHFFPALLAIASMALLALRMRLRSSAIGPAVAVHFGYNAVIALSAVYSTWLRHSRG
jgi:membrane protease YdiL (CAAX protease family)